MVRHLEAPAIASAPRADASNSFENVDIMSYVQWVLRDSYMGTIENLKAYAEKVQFYSEVKKRVREELKRARDRQAANTPCKEEDEGKPSSLANGGPLTPHVPVSDFTGTKDVRFEDESVPPPKETKPDTTDTKPLKTTKEIRDAERRANTGAGHFNDTTDPAPPPPAPPGVTRDLSSEDVVRLAREKPRSTVGQTPYRDTQDFANLLRTNATDPQPPPTADTLKAMALQWENDRKDPKNQTKVTVPKMTDRAMRTTTREDYGKKYAKEMAKWYNELPSEDQKAAVRAWLEQNKLEFNINWVEHDAGVNPHDVGNDKVIIEPLAPGQGIEAFFVKAGEELERNLREMSDSSKIDSWDINITKGPDGEIGIAQNTMPPALAAAGYVPGSHPPKFGKPDTGDGPNAPNADAVSAKAEWKSGDPVDTYAKLKGYIKYLEDKLNTVGDDTQLANNDLQHVVQLMQQNLQIMTNISKTGHDTILTIIRHLA